MKCMGHKSIEKKEDTKFTIWIEKTRLIKCLLHGLAFSKIRLALILVIPLGRPVLSRTKLTWRRWYQCIVSTLIYILFSLSSRSLAAISRFFCAFTCSDEISENFDAIWPKNKNILMKLIKNRRIRRIDIKTCHHFYLFIYLFVFIFAIFQDTVPRRKT